MSELIGNCLRNVVYLDKDDLGRLVRRSFALSGEAVDMDGAFYLQNLRSDEYATPIKEGCFRSKQVQKWR